MKNLYLYICMLICSFTALSQNENNHWMIGNLDFNFSTNPNTVNTITSPYDRNGYGASMSDASGNLLFYFDGWGILYNKNHERMENGVFPTTTRRSNQSAVIIPHPGNPNRYFLVWSAYHVTTCVNCTANDSYYYYAEIDFTNNSLGEVLPASFGGTSYPDFAPFEGANCKALRKASGYVIKNAGDFRPLTVAKNAANNGYWVITQSENSILSYKIDPSGFNEQPVTSVFSSLIYNGFYPVFRVAPDYANTANFKLYGMQPGIRLYSTNFNNSTGVLSNYIQLPGDNGGDHFEFSPDYKNVYLVVGNKIAVKDLTSLSTPLRILNEFSSPTTVSSNLSSIQKDRYGNLLISSQFGTSNRNKYIHKIENPNSFSSSSVKINHIYLNENDKVEFLPQLIDKVPVSCIENITLSVPETITSNSYKVSNNITTNANYSIKVGSTITLQAGNAVYLDPNTDINGIQGSTFIAEIKACTVPIMIKNTSVVDLDNNNESMPIAKNGFIIYPNPSTDVTTFSLVDGLIRNITITSMEGFAMYKSEVMNNSHEINVSNFKKGIYIVTVETTNGDVYIEKLMKN